MSSFFIDLWESIFTPGPTPTILYATNLSFGALQLVLLALLLATASIHFVVLSVLCGGLWWGINWFAREVALAQGQEREREREEAGKKDEGMEKGKEEESSDTEVELMTGREDAGRGLDVRYRGGGGAAKKEEEQQQQQQQEEEGKDAAAVSQSSASTEDEWEKVSRGT
ncbi:hypothetical protein E4U55_006238 [Claviceps digitariae]|nr:hypothetical protein E4U55_006238 [Claviceps digitariae]